MSKNINIIQKSSAQLTSLASATTVSFMAAAAILGMIELPNHENSKVIVPNQPSFAFAGESNELQNNPLRREKESEETAPHYLSYSVAQRTPARTGRQ